MSKQNINQKLPKVAALHSIKVDVEKGKSYMWCSCGLSGAQPFCDGSHLGTEFVPLNYVAENDMRIGFCGCKYSKNKPFCDGTHKVLNIEVEAE